MAEMLSYPFFVRALLAALMVGVILPLLGVFVVSRRLSFYTEAVAHSAYTGLALSALLHTPPVPTLLITALLASMAITLTLNRTQIPADTVIGVYLAICAAGGILLLGMLSGYNPSLFQYLFGDILALSWADVAVIGGALVCAGVVLFRLWPALVRLMVHREMAVAAGTPVVWLEIGFLALLACVVTLSLKLIGIVLVTAMFLLPTAAARNLATSLRSMAWWAAGIGCFSGLAGMVISYQFNTASGAAIVMVAAVVFGLTLLIRRR